MKTTRRLTWHSHPACPTYVLTDRLHRERTVLVTADEVIATVSTWLAQLGVHSPLVEDFGRTIRDGDWAGVHAIADMLSVDVTLTA